MAWQDTVLALTTVAFAAALVPSIVSRATRISRKTSIPTALAVWLQAAIFSTLDLWWTVAGTILIALAWTYLAIARATRA